MMLYCSLCGRPLPPGWRYCPVCTHEAEETKSICQAALCLRAGNVALTRGRSFLAAFFYRAALEINPTSWEALFNLGCLAWQQGDIGHAIALWEKSLVNNPENYLAHFNLGTFFLYNRNLNAARYHLTRVRRIKPGFLEGRVNLGTTYLLLGKLEAARREYAFVLEQDPGHKGARRGLALIARTANT
ncbi:tetratricopeptide repeat protein [Neomoorella humiferrea]